MSIRNRLLAAVDEAQISDKALLEYFTANPQPTDDQIHQLAADNKLTPDQLEDRIYQLFGKALSEIRKQEAAITVTAALELAGDDDTVPMRTVLMKAGGVGELRKLPANKALTLIRKAASDLSKDRKAAGKTYKIDKDSLTKWIDDNCAAPKSRAKPAAKPAAKKEAPAKKPAAKKPAAKEDESVPEDIDGMNDHEVYEALKNEPKFAKAIEKCKEAYALYDEIREVSPRTKQDDEDLRDIERAIEQTTLKMRQHLKAQGASKPAAKPAAKEDAPVGRLDNVNGKGLRPGTKELLTKLNGASDEEKADLAELYDKAISTKGPRKVQAFDNYTKALSTIVGKKLSSEEGRELIGVVSEHLGKDASEDKPAKQKPAAKPASKVDNEDLSPTDVGKLDDLDQLREIQRTGMTDQADAAARRIADLEEQVKPAKGKKAVDPKDLPPSSRFATGNRTSKQIKRNADGHLSVGNSTLVPKGDGFVLTWDNGTDKEKIPVKSKADLDKLSTTLKGDWDDWVAQYKAGDVSASDLRAAKDSYEEYVALLLKAKEHFAEVDAAKNPEAQPKPELKMHPKAQETFDMLTKAKASPLKAVQDLVAKLAALVRGPQNNRTVVERNQLLNQIRKEMTEPPKVMTVKEAQDRALDLRAQISKLPAKSPTLTEAIRSYTDAATHRLKDETKEEQMVRVGQAMDHLQQLISHEKANPHDKELTDLETKRDKLREKLKDATGKAKEKTGGEIDHLQKRIDDLGGDPSVDVDSLDEDDVLNAAGSSTDDKVVKARDKVEELRDQMDDLEGPSAKTKRQELQSKIDLLIEGIKNVLRGGQGKTARQG